MFSIFESIGRKLARLVEPFTRTKPKENDDVVLLTVVGPGRQCQTCYNIRDVDDFTAKDSCEHLKVTCRFCFKGYLDMRTHRQAFSFDCWQCGYEIDHTALKDLIPAKDFEAYDQMLLAFFLAKEGEYNACLSRKCGHMFFLSDGCAEQQAECPYCETKLCKRCFRPISNHKKKEACIDFEEKASKKLMKKMGVKRCPNCSVPIEKSGGCAHMHCVRCNTHFCWECRSQELRSDIIVHEANCRGAPRRYNNAIRALAAEDALQQAHRTAEANERAFNECYQRRNISRLMYRIETALNGLLHVHAHTAQGRIATADLLADLGAEITALTNEFESRIQRWDLGFVMDRGVNEDPEFEAQLQEVIDTMCENHAVGWSRGSDQSIRIDISWRRLERWMEVEQGRFHARA